MTNLSASIWFIYFLVLVHTYSTHEIIYIQNSYPQSKEFLIFQYDIRLLLVTLKFDLKDMHRFTIYKNCFFTQNASIIIVHVHVYASRYLGYVGINGIIQVMIT